MLCKESGVSFQRKNSPEPVHYDQCPACGASDITLLWCKAPPWLGNAATGQAVVTYAGMGAITREPDWYTLTVPDHEIPRET